ncbi:MAG: OmpP1/FadL family transporter [Flavobacteriales bacterium]
MKKQVMFCWLVAICATTNAQNETDALRYSYTQRAASARSLSMGSSFGALGADISSIFTNPAGMGTYKRAGFECSFGLLSHVTDAQYEGSSSSNSSTPFYVNTAGMIGNKKPKHKDWTDINFGIGYTKTNNFNERISITGAPFGSSILQVFATQASGTHPDLVTDEFPFGAGLAYQVYAIDPQDTAGVSYVPNAGQGIVQQHKNIRRTGAQGETSFGFGANYRDVLQIGASLNYISTSFYDQSTYTENYESDEALKNIAYNETLRSNGNGVSLKLGVIVKPTQWLRAGVAYHTPAAIGFRENYNVTMTSAEQNGTTHDWNSPMLVTTYKLRTPSRLLANAAFVLGKAGVITADYEYAAYNNMDMRGSGSNNYNYETENDVISTIYRGVHRVGAGLEMRVAKEFALRGGVLYQQSPFVNGVAANSSWLTYSGGFGYRTDYFFCDLAASYASDDRTYYLYQTIDNQPANITATKLNFLLSLGFRY